MASTTDAHNRRVACGAPAPHRRLTCPPSRASCHTIDASCWRCSRSTRALRKHIHRPSQGPNWRGTSSADALRHEHNATRRPGRAGGGSEERTDGDAPASHWRRPTCQSCRLSLQRYDAPNYRLRAYPPKPASPNSWLGCTTAVTVIDQAISSLLISSRNTIISFGRTIAKSDEIHLPW